MKVKVSSSYHLHYNSDKLSSSILYLLLNFLEPKVNNGKITQFITLWRKWKDSLGRKRIDLNQALTPESPFISVR